MRERIYNILRAFPNGLTEREVYKIIEQEDGKAYRNAAARILELTSRYRGDKALVKIDGKRKSLESNANINVYKVIDTNKDFTEFRLQSIKDLEKVNFVFTSLNSGIFKDEKRKFLFSVFTEVVGYRMRTGLDYHEIKVRKVRNDRVYWLPAMEIIESLIKEIKGELK